MIVVLLSLLAANPEGWKEHSREDDLVLFVRNVPGSTNQQLRVTAVSASSPEALCSAAFGDGKVDPAEPIPVVERRVLSEGNGERVLYERLNPPIGAEREYAVRYRLKRGPGTECSVTFDATKVPGEVRPGVIRLTKLKGSWRFVPRRDGRTEVSYEVWSEPGGSTPNFLVERTRRSGAMDWTRLVMKRAAR